MVDLKALVGSVERKVTAATIGSYAAGLIGLYAAGMANGTNVLDLFPRWVSILVAPLVPAVVAFASGYSARHTLRATTVEQPIISIHPNNPDPHYGTWT